MNRITVATIITCTIVLITVGFILMILQKKSAAEIYDFDTCAEAGYPVMESYPARCAYNGVTYTQVVKENLE
jgi:hypothetical protein